MKRTLVFLEQAITGAARVNNRLNEADISPIFGELRSRLENPSSLGFGTELLSYLADQLVTIEKEIGSDQVEDEILPFVLGKLRRVDPAWLVVRAKALSEWVFGKDEDAKTFYLAQMAQEAGHWSYDVSNFILEFNSLSLNEFDRLFSIKLASDMRRLALHSQDITLVRDKLVKWASGVSEEVSWWPRYDKGFKSTGQIMKTLSLMVKKLSCKQLEVFINDEVTIHLGFEEAMLYLADELPSQWGVGELRLSFKAKGFEQWEDYEQALNRIEDVANFRVHRPQAESNIRAFIRPRDSERARLYHLFMKRA